MKIIIIGGTGTIGNAIAKELSPRHSLVIAGHKRGEIQVDITNKKSIENMYQTVRNFDAVISATGIVHFGPLVEMTDDLYEIGLKNKLMGQINLVLIGLRYINSKGSFTLTSGVLSHDPICFGSSASMVNGAIESFAKAAAIEMPNSNRINVVSPTVLTESMDKFGSYFRGFESVSADRVALAYSKSVEGAQTGQIYRVGF